jgi:hypothetical protein
MDDEETIEPPDPRVILIAGGFTGIVAPGECGCRLDDLMPCQVESFYHDKDTGMPSGCKPGYAHSDPRGGTNWLVSTKKEPLASEAFDAWSNLT